MPDEFGNNPQGVPPKNSFNASPLNQSAPIGSSQSNDNPFGGATDKSLLEQTDEAKKREDGPIQTSQLPPAEVSNQVNSDSAQAQNISSSFATDSGLSNNDQMIGGSEPKPLVTPPASADASSSASAIQAEPEEESAKVPDTDEFLRKILAESPAPQVSESNQTAQGVPTEQIPTQPLASTDNIANVEPVPEVFNQPSAEPIATDNGLSQESSEGSISFDPNPQTKIKDGTDFLDGLNAGPKVSNEPQSEPIATDVIGAMQKKPAPQQKGSTSKLVGLAVVAVLLVVGGYVGYNSFLSPTATTDLASEVNDSEDLDNQVTVALTDDDKRKEDLMSLQSVLQDYWTNENKYPVSEELIFLSDAGNILEKSLVPVYLSVLPSDPDISRHYAYKSDGVTYTLTAVLDSDKDPNTVIENGLPILKVGPETALIAADSESEDSTVSEDKSLSSDASGNSTISSPPVPTLPTE